MWLDYDCKYVTSLMYTVVHSIHHMSLMYRIIHGVHRAGWMYNIEFYGDRHAQMYTAIHKQYYTRGTQVYAGAQVYARGVCKCIQV
jgi:hypothetical protein